MESIVDKVRAVAATLVTLPAHFESSYDEEADVLYLTFEAGALADDSELTEDDILLRYRDERLIGVTVLHASKRNSLALPG